MAAGSTLGITLARRLVRDERIYPFAIAVVVGGLVSARLAHVADNLAFYAARPDQVVAFWNGGMAVTGAPIGAAIGGYLVSRRLGLPTGYVFDVAVIGIVLGEAIGRIGDVINGEHHALACAGLPWCVRYTHPATLGQRELVHPIAAYDLLVDLGIFAVLLVVWRRVRGRPPEGRIFWLYLVLYGGARALTSVLRLDPVVLAGLQEGQLLGLLYVATGVPVLIWLGRRARLASAPAGVATTMV